MEGGMLQQIVQYPSWIVGYQQREQLAIDIIL